MADDAGGLRGSLDRFAHLWKALTQQHHWEVLPTLRPLVPRDGVVVDIGAHAGQFTKLFSRLAPEGRVISVEPSPYALSILRPVVRLHRLRNVTIVPHGLSDTPGELVLRTPIKRSGAMGFGLASFADPGGERQTRADVVQVETLDSLVARLGLDRLDLIKCDVEGWEGHVLRGGCAAIGRFRPAIMLEVMASSLARAGETPEGIWEMLGAMGYVARRLSDGRAVSGFAGDYDYVFTAAPA
jgi:FkbM family methyltransferase